MAKIPKPKDHVSEDDKVDIIVDMTTEQFLVLAAQAHKADMTFNEFCNKMLSDYIKEIDVKIPKKVSKKRK